MSTCYKFILGMALILMVGAANAQTLKVAYTNPDSIVLAIPEGKATMKDLETYAKQLQGQLESKYAEFEAKKKDFLANQGNWIIEVLEDKVKEIKQLEESITKYQQEMQKTLETKEAKLFAPIYTKVRLAIVDVAKANGYDFVVSQDAAGSFPFIFTDNKHDITQLVIKKLSGS